MGYSNQAHNRDNGSNWITRHSLAAAIIVYALLSIPTYFWLQGPVGTVGRVPVSVAIGGLVLGTILLVPPLKSFLENRFASGYVISSVDTDGRE